jgi:murein DD-endopeptidase MepM/ murein hydrolase activator NlpD
MLGKVIVVAHGGELHTVYAGLSKISPIIKVGSRVKKGTVIGKIKRKLIFEATKNSKYINPIRLIRL